MQQQAIEKINSEIGKSNNPYIQQIGQYLITQVTSEEAAQNVLQDNKTVEGSLKAMEEEAIRRITNNRQENQHTAMVMFSDEEGYALVLKYFGIKQSINKEAPTVPKKTTSKRSKSTKKKVVDFPGNGYIQTSLEDFLGEEAFE